jgi:hypothetical protein
MTPRSNSTLAIVALIGLVCATPDQGASVAVPSGFTVLQGGDYDDVLISEFALRNGCVDVQIDSLARRSPSAAGAGSNLSSSATLYWSAFEPTLDSAGAAACRNVRRLRRTDIIPRAEYGGGLSDDFAVILAVNPDSIFECHDGSCSHVATGIVRNAIDYTKCLVGMAAPAPSADSALAWLRGRLASAPSIYLLQRPPIVQIMTPCADPVQTVVYTEHLAAPRALSTTGAFQGRLQVVGNSWTAWGDLAAVGERWSDTVITSDLALHQSANAGDYFSPETLHFSVQALRAPAMVDPPATFAYPTGIKTYQYRGWDSTWTCPDGVWNRRASSIGDSLKLEGVSVRLSNDGCARPGIDVFADKNDRWIFAPSGSGSLVDEFRHGSSLGYGNSWPISQDTVWVAGWGIPLAKVQAITSIQPIAPRSTFRAVVHSGALELTLPSAITVDLVTPAGRRIDSRQLPAGISSVALGSYRGLLIVRAGGQIAQILAP